MLNTGQLHVGFQCCELKKDMEEEEGKEEEERKEENILHVTGLHNICSVILAEYSENGRIYSTYHRYESHLSNLVCHGPA
jgi:hypothetical protein